MVFLSICTALYDYTPQADGELPLTEGELVYVLEKDTEDDWWKAKKKAPDDEEEEPMGLVPNNYVEEARPSRQAKALYDYSRQTDEELSFSEDATLAVYDQSDPDWTLVGLNGEFGFAPANYIEVTGDAEPALPTPVASPPLPTRPAEPTSPQEPSPADSPVMSPAANLASILSGQAPPAPAAKEPSPLTPDTSDEEPPPVLPQRPASQARAPAPPPIPSPQASPPPLRRESPEAPSPQISSPRIPEPRYPETRISQPSPPSPEPAGILASPPLNRVARDAPGSPGMPPPGGYHLYNINEMVSIMGKQKKMPTVLGINLATGVIMISPEKKRDGPQKEWSAEKLTHYSIEGKHVFMELVKPSRSIDFHAGARDTAEEIVSSLGELAGMARAEGLREVIAAGSGGKAQKKGHMLYEFMAQGDDEVTVAENDDVIILDDQQSEEWWKVRRVKNGKEGVVPSSYVEVTGTVSPPLPPLPTASGRDERRSTVEVNRREEERLAHEALRDAERQREEEDRRFAEVGPGLKLPNRGSSLMARRDDRATSSQRSKRESRADSKSNAAKTKPDLKKVRTWTDRSGTFKVEAQFIGLRDGKIHLHKLNGVKIAVPVSKMAVADLEYVEKATGTSLDEDKPLSDIRAKSQRESNGVKKQESKGAASASAPPQRDWFDFFLKCGVNPYQCDRYSAAFNSDSIDEGVLAELTPEVLRTLGIREGDIIRVMKYLDTKYGRNKSKLRNVSTADEDGGKGKGRNVSFGGEEVIGKGDGADDDTASGSLFSGPGGALKNKTRKGRPAPAAQTNDIVDSKVFQQRNGKGESESAGLHSPEPPEPPSKDDVRGGFDDDAWDVKPSKQSAPSSQGQTQTSSGPSAPPKPAVASPPPVKPTPTGAAADLSQLAEPLKPVVTHSTGVQPSQSQVPLPQTIQPLQQQQQPPTQQFSQQQQQLPQQFSQQQPQMQLPSMQQGQPLQQGATPGFFGQLNPQMTGMPQQANMNQHQPNMQQMQQTGTNQINQPRQRPQAPQYTQQGPIMPPPPPRPLSAPQNASGQNNFGPPPLQPQLTGISPQPTFQGQTGSPPPSLNDMNRMRLQQQIGQMQPQQQMAPQMTGYGPAFQGQYSGQTQPQQTGMQQSPYLLGAQAGSPFADPQLQQRTGFAPQMAGMGMQPQQTGMGLQQQQTGYGGLMPQQTGINSVLSPPLQPQATGLQPQSTGMNGLAGRPAFGQPPPPMPSIPSQYGGPQQQQQQGVPTPPPIPQQQQAPAPLQPQKTGPAPAVRFGVGPDAKKLAPQPTGRRANLAHATPDNPFGF